MEEPAFGLVAVEQNDHISDAGPDDVVSEVISDLEDEPGPHLRRQETTKRQKMTKSIYGVPLDLWHRRFAHPHPTSLKKVLKLGGNEVMHFEGQDCNSCLTCIKAKMRQRSSKLPVKCSKIPFELIHSYLCGPMTASIEGASYYILYIDD